MAVESWGVLVQLCGWLELCGSACSHLMHSLPACCSPRMPAAVLVFIAVGSAGAAEDESSFPAASVSQPLPRSGAAEHNALPHPTFLPVQGWNSTAGRESGWIPNELFLASIWFPFLLMIWKMQTMLWKGGTVLQAGSVHFPSFISCNNNLESLFIKQYGHISDCNVCLGKKPVLNVVLWGIIHIPAHKNACSTLLSASTVFPLLAFQATDGADILSRHAHFGILLLLIWSCGFDSKSL